MIGPGTDMIASMRSPLALVLVLLALVGAAPARAQDKDKEEALRRVLSGLGDAVEYVQGGADDATRKNTVRFLCCFDESQFASAVARLGEIHASFAPRGVVVVGVCGAEQEAVSPLLERAGGQVPFVLGCEKKDGKFVAETWRAYAPSGLWIVLNRAGTTVGGGDSLASATLVDQVLRTALAARPGSKDPKEVEQLLKSARDASKRRNYKEALGLYEKALDGGASVFDGGMECWRMLAEQAKDEAGAAAYLRKVIDGCRERFELAEVVRYLASDPSIRKRDLAAAAYAADKLKALPGSDEDPDALSARAALAAASGDYPTAVDLQYSAVMSAPPAEKAALQRALEIFEQKAAAAAPK